MNKNLSQGHHQGQNGHSPFLLQMKIDGYYSIELDNIDNIRLTNIHYK